ncbi:hypothetical protein JCM6882_004898 [Rhodosporidiobolus microsporus]
MADSSDRKRRWDDHPAGPALEHGEGAANKAVKVEEGATAGGGAGDKAAEAAAAIAARLSSQYSSRPIPPPPPPLPSDAPPPPPPGMPSSGPNLAGSGGGPGGHGETSAAAKEGMRVERDRDREAGLFVEDIEINDLRNRYLLTKGPTQQQILAETGAAVLTKGVWYPDKSMATEKDPPLYLHITAESADKLTAGVAAVRALIDQDMSLENRGGRPAGAAGGDGGWGGRERRKWPEEKVMIELEPLRNFNIRAKTVGPAGLFVKFIQQETQTRVQIKGIGSGYIETETGRESDEPMHVHITGPDQPMIDKAATLARDLLTVVGEKHAEARKMLEEQRAQHQQQQQGQGYGQQQQMYGQPLRFGGATGANAEGSPYAYSANQYSAPGLTAPLPPGEAPPAPPAGDAAAAGQTADPSGQMSAEAYTAWWNSLDEASKAYYTQYYAAYAQYTSGAAAAPAASAPGATPAPPSDAPPPPPPSDAPPPPPPTDAPPPPPPQGGSGAYGAVPPPPGM